MFLSNCSNKQKTLNQFHGSEILCFFTKHSFFKEQIKGACEALGGRNVIKLGI